MRERESQRNCFPSFHKYLSLTEGGYRLSERTAMASLRAVVPRASLSLRSQQLRHRLILPLNRSATTAPPPPKPRVLEKPERFNPPSHGSRLKRPRQYPGPPLSQKERQAQQTRKYPHMMPAEGTWMFWFLTNRAVHLYITLVIAALHTAQLPTLTDMSVHTRKSCTYNMVPRLRGQHPVSRPPTA